MLGEELVYRAARARTFYGIHAQNHPCAQTKLISCLSGRCLDYVVDLRRDSPTYTQWVRVELSAQNARQMYVPAGFGHGCLTLEPETVVVMHVDQPFDPELARVVRHDDPTIGLDLPDGLTLAPWDVEAPYLPLGDLNL